MHQNITLPVTSVRPGLVSLAIALVREDIWHSLIMAANNFRADKC